MKFFGYFTIAFGIYIIFTGKNELGLLIAILGNLYVMQSKTVTLAYEDLEKQIKEKHDV